MREKERDIDRERARARERERESVCARVRERERARVRERERVMMITAHIVFSLCLTCIIKLFSVHNLLLIMCSKPFHLLHCYFRNTI